MGKWFETYRKVRFNYVPALLHRAQASCLVTRRSGVWDETLFLKDWERCIDVGIHFPFVLEIAVPYFDQAAVLAR